MPAVTSPPQGVKLFLCGDVMTGRGIDQILAHPSAPRIYEPYLDDAREYVHLAEAIHGPLTLPVPCEYVWGDSLLELAQAEPDLRLINLETSVTTCDEFWPGKGINYRMHPANIATLQAAGIDCCVLANNHTLDWGRAGLIETLEVLDQAGIKSAGAGKDGRQAGRPAIFPLPGPGRLLLFAYGCESSGVPPAWAAGPHRPGLNVLADLSPSSLTRIKTEITALRQPGDLVVVSLHWGDNWGYAIPGAEQRFAHQLIDEAGVAVVYGHSSHHFKAMEVYQGRLILYGCGDFLNDYEGIGGYAEFRADLALMYFPTMASDTGQLLSLRLIPRRIHRLQSVRVEAADLRWVAATLNREGRSLGTGVRVLADGGLELTWEGGNGR